MELNVSLPSWPLPLCGFASLLAKQKAELHDRGVPRTNIALGIRVVGIILAWGIFFAGAAGPGAISRESIPEHLFSHGDAKLLQERNPPRCVQILDRILGCAVLACMTVCTREYHIDKVTITA
jgi:hypothetical protein